jgi:Flp pilus assembly protein TadG
VRTSGRKDTGSAIVDFVLVAPLLIAVALAIIQVVLVMHVRTVLTSAAAEGARAAALAGADPGAGERRARAIIDETIASDSVERIVVRRQIAGGSAIMALDIEARLPLLGLFGPTAIHVRGHSLQEQA